MRRKIMVVLALLALVTNAVADITVSDIEVFSGYPWNEVAIGYTISGANGTLLVVEANDLETGRRYLASNTEMSKSISGAELTVGRHILKWDMAADGIRIKSNKVAFSVKVWERKPKYCVVNLMDYSVEYIDEIPSGGWTDKYKTTKLVLKLIGPGQFKIQNEYDVVLTKPFYMGVFEVTLKQWRMVRWSESWLTYEDGDMRPVDEISYMDIRGKSAGTGWPANDAVDADSFLGKLRERTGLNFDLPTEAQWEYACRAGTTTTYSYGDSANGDYMWFWGNTEGLDGWTIVHNPRAVGTRLPNPWGLYDVHGNAREWCLDWFGDLDAAMDPKGANSGSARVARGGSSKSYPPEEDCSSFCRCSSHQTSKNGFRLALTLRN